MINKSRSCPSDIFIILTDECVLSKISVYFGERVDSFCSSRSPWRLVLPFDCLYYKGLFWVVAILTEHQLNIIGLLQGTGPSSIMLGRIERRQWLLLIKTNQSDILATYTTFAQTIHRFLYNKDQSTLTVFLTFVVCFSFPIDM